MKVLICGDLDATAADAMEKKWTILTYLPCHEYRNQRMLDEGKPDLVVALPGGRGTADMIARAEAAGVPVIDVACLLSMFATPGRV